MAGIDIDTAILTYIKDSLARSDFPSRAEMIRTVTGQLSVLPSEVAKAFSRMVEAGTLKHGPGDQISIKP